MELTADSQKRVIVKLPLLTTGWEEVMMVSPHLLLIPMYERVGRLISQLPIT